MKKLSLLIFSTLILGCATETPMESVVEEPPPVVIEPEPIGHPLVAEGTVKHGQVNVDPSLLNSHGFHFEFTQGFLSFWVLLYVNDTETLDWDATVAGDTDRRDSVRIRPIADSDLLEHDTEYKLVMSFYDSNCDKTDIVIQFRTKPQRLGVKGAEPVIQERPPVVPSGERFRFDPALPELLAGDVFDGEDNVDPEKINEDGFRFEFRAFPKLYRVDRRMKNGEHLHWHPQGVVDRNIGDGVVIQPMANSQLLEFDTEYVITIFIQNRDCWFSENRIHFRTKPK